MKPPSCRHCGQRPAYRPRGLCFPCYYTPGVKSLYPSTSKFAREGLGAGNKERRQADAPTTAPPGSEAKIAVMEARVKANRQPFHPQDARWPGDARPLEYMRAKSMAG